MHATEFVHSYFDAWNHRDPKGVADHLDLNGIYCDIPANAQHSPDELIGSLSDFFARYRHRYELIGEILTGEDSISFQYQIHPCGSAGSGSSSTSYRGAEFVTLNGDAAITITDFYEFPEMGQVGQSKRLAAQTGRKNKYAKSGLSSDQIADIRQRLRYSMQSRRIYLMQDLTLPKLADAIGCTVNHLSQVINADIETSFFELLNRHRIDHARELLSRDDTKDDAILSIAFRAGFNSDSTFYAAFKKYVGQTPAQFRQTQLKDPGSA